MMRASVRSRESITALQHRLNNPQQSSGIAAHLASIGPNPLQEAAPNGSLKPSKEIHGRLSLTGRFQHGKKDRKPVDSNSKEKEGSDSDSLRLRHQQHLHVQEEIFKQEELELHKRIEDIKHREENLRLREEATSPDQLAARDDLTAYEAELIKQGTEMKRREDELKEREDDVS
jgi:hypothetical protein